MSQATVLAQVKTKLEAITGIKKVLLGAGKRMATVSGSYPYFVVELTPAQVRMRSYSTAGTAQTEYTIYLTLYLGPKEMDAEDAQKKMLPYSGRLRASFAPDWKLGGTCFNSDLQGPADNLTTYIDTKRNPKVQWALRVQEQVAANAVAV